MDLGKLNKEEYFGFDGLKPKPASPEAQEFADLISEVSFAEERLTKAMDNVPTYTGQWGQRDYYAEQQENYYRAVDSLWNFVKENLKAENGQ